MSERSTGWSALARHLSVSTVGVTLFRLTGAIGGVLTARLLGVEGKGQYALWPSRTRPGWGACSELDRLAVPVLSPPAGGGRLAAHRGVVQAALVPSRPSGPTWWSCRTSSCR